jgi:hypothetical protein
LLVLAFAVLLGMTPESARGQTAPEHAPVSARRVDRVVVRFHAPETGGVERPRFVFERLLAFQARIEALAAGEAATDTQGYRERHLNAALERHISEVLLSSLRIEPEPSQDVMARQLDLARRLLADRVGGDAALVGVQLAESVTNAELGALLRRQARASLYLDRMVAPMLRPSDAELELIQRSAPPELQNLPFERVRGLLLRWYVSRRLSTAMSSFFQEARSRIAITLL